MIYKKAVITGASSGIGRAVASEFAALGLDLVLVARRGERLQAIRREIEEKHKVNVESLTLDVRNRKQVAEKLQGLKGVDVLVNNAGLAKGVSRVHEAEIDDWEEMIDTNVKGLLYFTRCLLPQMLELGRGHVFNLGSVAGRWVYPGGAVYCATKFAVRALSEGLRMDLIGSPVRVTNIEPGLVETEFSKVRLNDAQKAKAVYRGLTPLSGQDVAESLAWCLARPAHVNVQELVLFPVDQAAIQQIHRKNP